MKRLGAALVAAAALSTATPLGAQQRAAAEAEEWSSSWVVYPSYNSLERFGITGVIGWRLPPRAGPQPITAAFDIQAKLSTSGTRSIQLQYDAPGRSRNWRWLALVGAERATRAPFYGLGNSPRNDSAEAANGDTLYNRYRLLRTTVYGATQRRLSDHVRAYGGLQWRHFRAVPNPGSTRFGDDLASGAVTDSGSSDKLEVRLGLLYDTRDEEESPSRGVFLEAVAARGLDALSGDFGYWRWMAGARVFVPVTEYTSVGMRTSLELGSADLPFFVTYERLTSWRPEDGFGGTTTLRANIPGRWLAPNRAVVSVDLRNKRIDVPIRNRPIRLWLLAFADAGFIWLPGERPAASTLQGGAGVGTRLQYSKSGMFGFDLGYSRDAGIEFATAFQFAY